MQKCSKSIISMMMHDLNLGYADRGLDGKIMRTEGKTSTGWGDPSLGAPNKK